MIAHVVPITRLRRATGWWSYRIPAQLTCSVGSLVVIPFRGRPTLGIIWNIEKEDSKATAALQEVITENPLVRQPHRHFIEWLSEAGICSLSTALHAWLPKALGSWPLQRNTLSKLHSFDKETFNSLKLQKHRQHLVMVPGHRPDMVKSLTKKAGTGFTLLFSEPESPEFETWLSVASGKVQFGMGRERALFAPWLNLQKVTISEPEDISYYHEQIPYLNLVEAAEKLAEVFHAEFQLRSYVPSEAATLVWPKAQSSRTSQATAVQVVGLERSRVINEELLERIRLSLSQKQDIILLYNSLDRTVRDEKGLKLLPGIQTLTKQLAAALNCLELPASIHLGTRALFEHRYNNVGLTAVLALDPLLHQTNFAEQLHGWADLGHLFSYSAPCLIQVHNAHHPLVQALRNNQFGQYCREVTEQQEQTGLAPFAEEIVCAVKTSAPATPSPDQLYTQLFTLIEKPWQLSHPFITLRRKEEMSNLLLHAPRDTRLSLPLRQKLASLARPWKIQRNPWYTI